MTSDPTSDPIDFDDLDPEDAYDAGDPLAERMTVLGRVVDDVDRDPTRAVRRRIAARELVERLEDELHEVLEDLAALSDRLG